MNRKGKKIYCELLYVRVPTWCSNTHLNAYVHRGQRRASDLLGLELQVVVSSLIWMLGI